MDGPAETNLPLRELGTTGITVTGIGLGGVGLGGVIYGEKGEANAIATVERALERGVNYIDTAPGYYKSEARIGMALQGVPRNRYVLSTKVGSHPDRRHDFTRNGVLWSVENSLRTLGTDRLDICLIHDPRTEENFAALFEAGMALETLDELKAKGVIRAIGLGQGRYAWHEQAMRSGRFDVIMHYNDYHPLNTSAVDTLLPLAREHGVGNVNGSPLAHGLLTGAPPSEWPEFVTKRHSDLTLKHARRLYAFCQEEGVDMLGLVFQFCLRQELVDTTITGASTPEEMEATLRAATTPLPEDVWPTLEALGLAEKTHL